MSPTAEKVSDVLTEHVHARLVVALLDAGRRPEAAEKVAAILTPTFLSLLANPDVRRAALIATARMPI